MVSALLLSIGLLWLALPLSGEPAKSGRTAAALADIDRCAGTYANIQHELAHISALSINLSVSNGSVLVEERLPVSAARAGELENFAQFERLYSDLNVSVNASELEAGTFRVMPGNTLVTHNGNYFRITPEDSADGAGAVSSYNITLTFPVAAIDSAQWQQLSAPGNGSDSVAVHVHIQDASYATYLDFEASLDKHAVSVLNITQGGALAGYVRFGPPAALEIYSDGNVDLKALTVFNNPVYVETNDSISVRSLANKTGRIRVA